MTTALHHMLHGRAHISLETGTRNLRMSVVIAALLPHRDDSEL